MKKVAAISRKETFSFFSRFYTLSVTFDRDPVSTLSIRSSLLSWSNIIVNRHDEFTLPIWRLTFRSSPRTRTLKFLVTLGSDKFFYPFVASEGRVVFREKLPYRTRSRECISLLSRRSCPPGLVANIYFLLIGYVLSISGLPNRKSRCPTCVYVPALFAVQAVTRRSAYNSRHVYGARG